MFTFALVGLSAFLAALGAGTDLVEASVVASTLYYTFFLVAPLILLPAAAIIGLINPEPMYIIAYELGLFAAYNNRA